MIAEVTDGLLYGHKTARQLVEVEAPAYEFSECFTTEAWAECQVLPKTGTGAGVAQTPEFDRSTSCTMFQRQFETTAEHNGWTPGDKATYLIAAFSVPSAHSTLW
jgi:hypothetical protein